MNNFRPTV